MSDKNKLKHCNKCSGGHKTEECDTKKSPRLSKSPELESCTPPLPIELQDLVMKNKISERDKEIQSNRQVPNSIKRICKKTLPNSCHEDNGTKTNEYSSSELSDNFNSEDEEHIIELRRKKRKQLLNKLSSILKDNSKKSHGQCLDNKVSTIDKPNTSTVTSNENSNSERLGNMNSDIVTDMFSEQDNINVPGYDVNNSDDSEAYYNIRVGEILNNRYTVKKKLGQGIFANVVQALDKSRGNSNVAIKIARNQDIMYYNGMKELSLLGELNRADVNNKSHCVRLYTHFMHKGHLCLVLEMLTMDLRSVIKRCVKDQSFNIKAIISYSKQLFAALFHLKQLGIVHADIKPDNILINEKKNILKLCDFGSAERVNEYKIRPYLVSRFYRAPEIILGAAYGHPIDMWSAGCTLYEMATGKIMFTGGSNNKMLKVFMDVKGKFPNRMLKFGKFKDQHFNHKNNFILHRKDKATGRTKMVEISNIHVTRDLVAELKKSKILSVTDDKKLFLFRDLIDKMLILDPVQRVSVADCLSHPFVQQACE